VRAMPRENGWWADESSSESNELMLRRQPCSSASGAPAELADTRSHREPFATQASAHLPRHSVRLNKSIHVHPLPHPHGCAVPHPVWEAVST
jgi:hypothetical protein